MILVKDFEKIKRVFELRNSNANLMRNSPRERESTSIVHNHWTKLNSRIKAYSF